MIPVRLYLYAGAVIAVVGGLWGWGEYRERQGRNAATQETTIEAGKSNTKAREAIRDAIRPDDDADSALRRLRERNARDE